MKHAGAAALDQLEPLLQRLRERSIKERSRGIFYRGSKAFLHFHEEGRELFADLRVEDRFQRFAVSKQPDRNSLLRRIDAILSDGPTRPRR
jgi:hypothetical protein